MNYELCCWLSSNNVHLYKLSQDNNVEFGYFILDSRRLNKRFRRYLISQHWIVFTLSMLSNWLLLSTICKCRWIMEDMYFSFRKGDPVEHFGHFTGSNIDICCIFLLLKMFFLVCFFILLKYALILHFYNIFDIICYYIILHDSILNIIFKHVQCNFFLAQVHQVKNVSLKARRIKHHEI